MEKELTPQEALKVLENVTEHPNLAMCKADHIITAKALDVFRKLINVEDKEPAR